MVDKHRRPHSTAAGAHPPAGYPNPGPHSAHGPGASAGIGPSGGAYPPGSHHAHPHRPAAGAMGGGGVPGVSAAPARNPSKISGHAKGIKGNVSHTLGRVTGSTTLQLKGHQDKMAGRAEVQAAKAHKFSQAAGQHQNAAAAQAYGGPMSNPAAGVKQNLAHMKMNHNAY